MCVPRSLSASPVNVRVPSLKWVEFNLLLTISIWVFIGYVPRRGGEGGLNSDTTVASCICINKIKWNEKDQHVRPLENTEPSPNRYENVPCWIESVPLKPYTLLFTLRNPKQKDRPQKQIPSIMKQNRFFVIKIVSFYFKWNCCFFPW